MWSMLGLFNNICMRCMLCYEYRKFLLFSPQNLIDCVTGCSGCNGGLMSTAFDYIIENQNGCICLEEYYEYIGADGTCKYDQYPHPKAISGYINVNYGDEDDLAEKLCTYGPASAGIDASNWSFQLYSGGIYDEPSCSSYDLDHGVFVVGFGSDGEQYWIVQNTWGTSWGEKRYIRMIKGKGNQCGIASMAIIATY